FEGMTLAIGTGNLWTIGDIPVSIALDDCGEFIVHVAISRADAQHAVSDSLGRWIAYLTPKLTCCRKPQRRRREGWRQSGAALCSVVAPRPEPPSGVELRRSGNFRPQCRWGKAREMADIRCGDHHVRDPQGYSLRRQNH